MKTIMFLICTVFCFSVLSDNFDASKYQLVELATLKTAPEELKNKKICYESKYREYLTTFPPYMEQSGFKTGKYLFLQIYPLMVPVMVKKTDEMNKMISKLPRNKSVKVYGKIQKYRIAPQQTILPRYYLELDNIEPIEKEVLVPDDKELDFNNIGINEDSNIIGPRSREKFKTK